MVNILFWSGVAIGTAAICLLIWAVKVRTTWDLPGTDPKEFVTRGPYRYLRHPGYVAQALLYVSAGPVVFGFIPHYSLLVIFLGWSVFICHEITRFAKTEEEKLAKAYGEAYAEYERRTARFIPFIY